MGLFDFLRKPKTDMEKYYEERNARAAQQTAGNTQFVQNDIQLNPYDGQNVLDAQTFRITVQDVFTITGRGTVITGQIESGSVRVGDEVIIQRINGDKGKTTVVGIEQFRKMLDVGNAGDNVGILLRNLTKSDIGKGDVLTK